MQWSDRVVVVTGASSGIGRALAQHLAGRGAALALMARRRDLLDELAAEISAAGGKAVALPVDITDRQAVFQAFAEAQQRLGRVDVLVNNAGVGYFGPVERIAEPDLDRLVRTNVYGPIFALQAALPALRQSRGLVCNVSSGLSKRTLPLLAPYAGTKSMLDALSDGMRMELRRHGIGVVNYCAPETETDFDRTTLRGEGVSVPAMRRRRRSPERVAARIAWAIEHERREVVETRSLVWMARVAPGLLDRMFQGMVAHYLSD